MTQSDSDQASHPDHIAWREWNDESFRLAQEQDRPVLLDISAVWCHWCHVMDQTSYSDPSVVDLIQRYFVPVRVDNDRRPDINERYNMGGWPTTAFLTPGGDVITGATYIAPEQMRSLLVRVADYYRSEKKDIANQTATLRQRLAAAKPPAANAEISAAIVGDVLQAIHTAADTEYGGFGDAPKFPHPDALELALRDHQLTGNSAALAIVTRTLDAMAAGGIYDPVEGGFFRYSTTRDWSIPHFEKMLEGNAGLLRNYLRAFQITSNTRYADVARDLMRYLTTVLSDQEQAGFYGSQDADEDYYGLKREDRLTRPAPAIDQTLYVDWNAMMASSYMLASVVLNSGGTQDYALRTLDRLWRICRAPDGGMYHYYDGQARLPGLLADQVHMGAALLDAYEVTADPSYVRRAEELARFCLASLADEGGGFRDSRQGPDAPGNLQTPLVPMPANAAAARLFVRLFWLTGNDSYRATAQRALARFALSYKQLGYFAAPYALAVDEMLRSPLKVIIVGDSGDVRLHELHHTALHLAEPWKVIQVLDPGRDVDEFARSGFPLPTQPLAYPCVGGTCHAPVGDAAALEAWAREHGSIVAE